MFQVAMSDGKIEYFENMTLEKVDEVLAELNKKLADLPNPREMH